jgi:cytochrome c oxidase subunit 2
LLAVVHNSSRIAGSGSALSPTNIFDPAGTPAHSTFELSMLVLSVTLGIFLVVASLLLYALIRYRQRPADSEREPAQIYGSNQIELSWTVIPILIVVMLFLATTRVILDTQAAPKPSGALDVTVIGHQFWWEYRYPKLGVVTANELHVPISDPAKPTPTYLSLSSADTDHSFWVPRLAGKTDLIPNRRNTMWIDPKHRGCTLGSVRSIAGRSMPRCCCGCTHSRRRTLLRGSGSSRGRRSRIFRTTLRWRRGRPFLCIARASTAIRLPGR